MNSITANVVDIEPYLRQREESNTTPVPLTGYRSSVSTQTVETLNANALQRLDPDAELSKFFALATKAISWLSTCSVALSENDPLSADDALMASKNTLSELLMYRDLNDAVAIVVFKCFQAVSATKAVTDAPQLPDALGKALQRICSAPFMKFEEACELVHKIEEASDPLSAPGYDGLVNELIGDAGLCEAQ